MIQPIRAKVVQAPRQIKARYGHCSIVKIRLLDSNQEVPIFSKENDSNLLKRYVDEEVQVYKDANQKWRLIDTSGVKNVNGNGLQPISEVISRTDVNIPNTQDLLTDVPMLSDQDKKKVAAFIKQQSKLLRYTVDVVKSDFPDMG